MAEFYKFEIGNWNEGTASLSLEQEAAYLRVVNAIRLADQPIAFNKFALCGLWRCNERKAARLLQELIDAGKLRVESGKIINDKAVDDASNLRRLRADRASAGSRGGIESGKSRAKALKDNNTGEAIASTREEKNREEKSSVSKDTGGDAAGADLFGEPDLAKVMFDQAVAYLGRHGVKGPTARAFVGKLRKAHPDHAIIAALTDCAKAGVVDPVPWITARMADTARKGGSGPKSGETRVRDGKHEIYQPFHGWMTLHV